MRAHGITADVQCCSLHASLLFFAVVAAKELAAHKEGWRGKAGSFLADAKVLASHPVYVLTVAGTTIYVGADPPSTRLQFCFSWPVQIPVPGGCWVLAVLRSDADQPDRLRMLRPSSRCAVQNNLHPVAMGRG